MGILNRTTDSFYDRGSYFGLDRFFERAEELVREGADVLDVGGVKAGPGPEVTEEEELERVVPVIASLHDRFDVPLSVDTWRASVAAAAFEAGAVLGNDISGFADPDYLPAAARAGASVVATHIRLAPRVPDPEPHYDDLVGEVARLPARARRARPGERDPGRSHRPRRRPRPRQDRRPVAATAAELSPSRLARLSPALVLVEQDVPRCPARARHRRAPRGLLGLGGVGIAGGCRLVRVHDVAGTCKVRDLLAAILESAPADDDSRAFRARGDTSGRAAAAAKSDETGRVRSREAEPG